MQNPNLNERNRELIEPHIRAIGTQQLDALLRIEELLQKLVDALPKPLIVDAALVDVSDIEKPGASVNVTKRKNPRQL